MSPFIDDHRAALEELCRRYRVRSLSLFAVFLTEAMSALAGRSRLEWLHRSAAPRGVLDCG